MRKLIRPSAELMSKRSGRPLSASAEDRWVICDSPSELLALSEKGAHLRSRTWHEERTWIGGTRAEARERALKGDLRRIRASDEMMSKLEDETRLVLASTLHIRRDVVGGAPLVPAFLAGHPAAMLRRERVRTDSAPLTILVDMVCSAGIRHEQLERRGIAILAFVRLLAMKRPVVLYAGAMGGNGASQGGEKGFFVMTRIETSPLDLARAGFMLSDPLATRGLAYDVFGVLAQEAGTAWSGGWPYDRGALSAEATVLTASGVFQGDLFAIPGFHLTDPLLSDPLGWVVKNIMELTGATQASQGGN